MNKIAKLSLSVLFGAMAVACGDSDSHDPIDEESFFLSVEFYRQTDFNLAQPSLYWELRQQTRCAQASDCTSGMQTIATYGGEALENLSEAVRAELEIVEIQSGFVDLCAALAATCGERLWSIVNATADSVQVLESLDDLQDFLGDIDTEAELNLWLRANQYQGLNFTANADGYAVRANIDPQCSPQPEVQLQVYADGQIDVLEIFQRDSMTCS